MKIVPNNKAQNYYVYVLRLRQEVWDKEIKFREENKHYDRYPKKGEPKPCSYVGSTDSKGIEARLKEHLTGYKKPGIGKWYNRYVKEYFKHRQPKQYSKINPIISTSSDKVRKKEKELAVRLRKKGWAVWQK